MTTKADALRHIEAAENILRDKNFIQLPTLPADATDDDVKVAARNLAAKLDRIMSPQLLAELDRALFKITVQGERKTTLTPALNQPGDIQLDVAVNYKGQIRQTTISASGSNPEYVIVDSVANSLRNMLHKEDWDK